MPETRTRPSRLNRLWRFAWRTSVGLFAAALLALIACSFDDKLLDTSALRYEPRTLPDGENAYLVLEEATESLGKIDDFQVSRWFALIRNADWDDAEAAELLRGREYAVDSVRQLRALSFAQGPIPKDAASAYLLHPRIHLPLLLSLLEARRLHRDGDLAGSLSLMRNCLHAARLMDDGRSGLLFAHYARLMHLAILDALAVLCSDPRTPLEDCRTLQLEISRFRPGHKGFQQTLAAAFREEELVVYALHHGKEIPESWHPEDRRYLAYRLPFLFKPRQTLNYSIPYLTTAIQAADLSKAEREKSFPGDIHALGYLCDQYDDLINRLGKRHAHDGGVPSASTALERRLDQQTRVSLAETLIALRVYHDEHGRRPPATLEELVPAYLPDIPRDYFDGGAIKYSRELHALWSVGPRGKFQLTNANQDVHERELIVPLCFDGSYVPWPRRDPNRARLFGDSENESGGPLEGPPSQENH